jgi:uncharacterized phiE125 gp8 family phage protein
MRTTVVSSNDTSISLFEVKNYLKVDEDYTLEDILISAMLKASIELVERFTGMSITTKVIDVYFEEDDLNEGIIKIPYPPHVTVDSIKSYDYKNTETELVLDTDYYIKGSGEKQIELLTNLISTTTTTTTYIARVTCGSDTVNDGLYIAILKQVHDFYENRENWLPVMSSSVRMICQQYLNKSSLQ